MAGYIDLKITLQGGKMSRPLRIEFAGALYHVTARGNAEQSKEYGLIDEVVQSRSASSE